LDNNQTIQQRKEAKKEWSTPFMLSLPVENTLGGRNGQEEGWNDTTNGPSHN